MTGNLTAEFNSLLHGRVRVGNGVETLRERYRSSKPFPHLVMDELFAPCELEELLPEAAAMARDDWLHVEHEQYERFLRMRSAASLGPAATRFVSIVHSAAFLYLLSEITGVWQLLPDPYLRGGGHALMRRDDFFNVHADRNVAYESGLIRRLALIVFLNRDWQSDYHGELELWNREATRCEVSIPPLFNRTVLFEVAYPNYHGVPQPLACPADRARQSFIVYYHTVGIDGQQSVTPHSSIFAPRLYGTKRHPLRSLAREVFPPFVRKVVRRLLK